MAVAWAVVLRLAWRNVWRNPRRTVLTVGATVFAVFLTVFVTAMAAGSHEKIIEDSARLASGHVQITGPGYLEQRTLEHFVHYDEALEALLAAQPGVEGFAARVMSFGLLSHQDATVGVGVMGVDPLREGSVTTLASRVQEGRFLEPGGHREVVLGQRLAHNLGAAIGDTLLLFSTAYSLETAYDLFEVVGIMRLPEAELERTLAVVGLADAQAFFVYGDRVSEVAVLATGDAQVPALVDTLRTALGGHGAVVHSWRESSPELEQIILLDAWGMYIALGILLVVVGFGILNTVLMAVLERQREFGVVLALGLRPASIFRVVYLESMLLAAVGLVIGLVLSVPTVWILEGHPIAVAGEAAQAVEIFGIEPVMTWALRARNPIVSALTILGVAFLAALYPATKASRAHPVDALRSL